MKPRSVNARPGPRIALLILAGAVAIVSLVVYHNAAYRHEIESSRSAAAETNQQFPGPPAPAPETGATDGGSPQSAPDAAETPGTGGTALDLPSAAAPQTATGGSIAGESGRAAGNPAAGEVSGKRLAPTSWGICFRNAGGAPDAYELVADSSTAASGSYSARIRSLVDRPSPSGAGICQVIAATAYRGKRVDVTLHMRTQDAMPGAHLVFRADASDGQVMAFYNMEPDWVSGNRNWAEYSAVLDVPERASIIVLGGSLVNTGTLWIDDAAIEVVSHDIPVTRPLAKPGPYNQAVDASRLSGALQNPGFETTFELPPDG